MLIYHRTSIFASPAQTVVNTVNCVGVMGKGVAAVFRDRYPDMFEQYRQICAQKLLEPGKLWLWKAPDQWVLNFPTKRHWRLPSKLEWIEAGLKKFAAEYERRGITEISFPRLGCGNGGLDWDDVRPLMEAHLSELPIPIYVHDFEVNIGSPEHLETSSVIRPAKIDRSFEEFIDALRTAVHERKGQFRSLGPEAPFTAEFSSERQLRLGIDGGSALIDVDDLRSVWVKLLKGVVTTRAADWGPMATGDHILSLLSGLPEVRTVQIQRRTSDHPELAVELRRRSGTQVAEDIAPERQELAWG
jgi:O-acetyl-ADP-ribose deacetylase (regulator of RNase III)